MKIEKFGLKGIIEKCGGCFFVYPFCGVLFYFLKKKRHYGIKGLNFCIKSCTR